MYAQNKNGKIRIYQSAPSEFSGSQKEYVSGFDQLSSKEQKAEGLFPLVTPEGYDSRIHNLGKISFDSVNSQFKYAMSDKTWTKTLAELKSNKIANLKESAKSEFKDKYDWYFIRTLRDPSKAVPEDIKTAANDLAALVDQKEKDINNLKSKSKVILFDITL